MDVRVITLRYSDGLQGFPEAALTKATTGREVLEVREHFFVHGNVPHLALIVLLGGDNTAVTELVDFDPRIVLGTVDMGADEYYYHLYHMGDVVPGSPIDVKVVGYPTASIILYLGSGIADPPYSTQHGDFFLNWPPLWQGNIGTVPGNGVLVLPTTVPTGWMTGEEHPLQALVGPWSGPWTRLTNAETLVVE